MCDRYPDALLRDYGPCGCLFIVAVAGSGGRVHGLRLSGQGGGNSSRQSLQPVQGRIAVIFSAAYSSCALIERFIEAMRIIGLLAADALLDASWQSTHTWHRCSYPLNAARGTHACGGNVRAHCDKGILDALLDFVEATAALRAKRIARVVFMRPFAQAKVDLALVCACECRR